MLNSLKASNILFVNDALVPFWISKNKNKQKKLRPKSWKYETKAYDNAGVLKLIGLRTTGPWSLGLQLQRLRRCLRECWRLRLLTPIGFLNTISHSFGAGTGEILLYSANHSVSWRFTIFSKERSHVSMLRRLWQTLSVHIWFHVPPRYCTLTFEPSTSHSISIADHLSWPGGCFKF